MPRSWQCAQRPRTPADPRTHRSRLGVAGMRVQQLLGRVQRLQVASNENRLPAHVDHGGEALAIRELGGTLGLKRLCCLKQFLIFLRIKLERERPAEPTCEARGRSNPRARLSPGSPASDPFPPARLVSPKPYNLKVRWFIKSFQYI